MIMLVDTEWLSVLMFLLRIAYPLLKLLSKSTVTYHQQAHKTDLRQQFV